MDPRDEDEERRLRSAALQNAQSILLARQRAEEEVVRAKEALELKTRELAHSLAMMRATLESTTDGILVTDGGGKVTGFNRHFVEMWRLGPEIMDSRDHRRVLEANARQFADPAEFVATVDAIYASSPAESQDVLELADGRVFERFSRIQFVDRRNVGRVWSFRDVTERKRAEKALRQRVESTRFLADASATLAELTDYESTLQRVASLAVPAFADWCAVDIQQADGSLRRLAVSDSDAPFPDDLPEPIGEEAQRGVLRQLGPTSYIRVPLRSRTRTLGAITFVTMESGRRYDADDLAAAEDLTHRAVIAIENASLLAALKESDRRKDEFLAILAHELRNPLAPIRNSVHILRAKGPPVRELQWATDVIDRQVSQMTRLVDDLLDVSRIAGGKIQLHKERIGLAAVVNSAVEASRPLIDKWRHELTVTMPAEPIELVADLTRLSQVLLNLLNNAAKYTDRGGRIGVTVERRGGDAVVRVKDNGIGIPAAMLPHIFGMFTQVDRSLERSEGGLGIGLTLVQRLVELHGGTVEAQSEGPGRGSEFIVRLPMAAPKVVDAPRHGDGDPASVVAVTSCRVLIVDDNRDSADTLAMVLQNLGHVVRTAHDGLECLAAATDFEPDVVLMDIGMPKLNGYDAARRIREGRGGAVVLIAVTGWGQDEDRRRSTEAGFDHHLTKPVDLGALGMLLATARRD